MSHKDQRKTVNASSGIELKQFYTADDIPENWDLTDVAISHRLGRLEIEDISLVVAIASPHRKDAFDACQYSIDRIKSVVPIWKKEYLSLIHI